MSMTQSHGSARTPLARLLKNISWLLSGKTISAICSLGYLAIVSRSLGLKDFGHFALITGTAQALAGIAGFQSWQTMVRFGVSHLHNKDWDRFGRVMWLCLVSDVAGALLGCAIAGVLLYGFNHRLGLNPGYINMAFAYACTSLLAITSATTGVMRTLDRFDTAMFIDSLLTVVRLVLSIIVWFIGPSVGRFLAIWALAQVIETVAYFAYCWKLAPRALRLAHLRDWRLAMEENPGIVGFLWNTFTASSLNAAVKQGPLLAVGAFVSTSAAGLFRMASQLTQALGRVSQVLSQAIYPEVTRARATAGHKEFRSLSLRISAYTGLVGLIIIALALFAGPDILAMVGGPAFRRGAPVFLPLAIAAAFELASVAFEPVLHSTGRANVFLTARIASVVALVVGIVAMIPMGGTGIAWAVALSGLVSYAAIGISAWRTLHAAPPPQAPLQGAPGAPTADDAG